MQTLAPSPASSPASSLAPSPASSLATRGQPHTVRRDGPHLTVSGIRCLDLTQTLDCGQAFRWSPLPDGRWTGIAGGRSLTLREEKEAGGTVALTLFHTSSDEYESFWRPYFDLDRNYAEIVAAVSGHPVLAQAAAAAGGIRILRQDAWEALCSFIISQNNNIPRIKGIIQRLCAAFGDPLEPAGAEPLYAFPSPQRLAGLELQDLSCLRAGFRAKYILDAARKVAGGEVDLDVLALLPMEEARASLMRIKGVGPKVADCALLFGAGRIEAFPADVWIKRAMRVLFDGRLPDCAAPYAGIVQQYIFHYARGIHLRDDPDRGGTETY